MNNRIVFQLKRFIQKASSFFLVCALIFCSLLTSCKNRSEATGSAGKSANEATVGDDLEVVEKTDPYGNTERYTRRLADYAKEGQYSKMSPAGELLETANYRNDTLHGLRVLYYETGDTQIVERYDNGQFSGPYKAFYEDGNLELEGVYVANYMEGIWKRYYSGGQLMEEVKFQDNQENGPFMEYHENGKIKAEGYYKDGDNEHGLLKIYDEEGELVKSMNCQHGVCRTVWEKEANADS